MTRFYPIKSFLRVTDENASQYGVNLRPLDRRIRKVYFRPKGLGFLVLLGFDPLRGKIGKSAFASLPYL